MSVYFGLLIFCVISSMIGRGLTINRFDIRAKIVDVLPFLALFVVSAFRYQVGKDYGIYVGTYDLIKTGQQARIDIFTYWVMKVMASLNLDVQCFFIVSSFIVNYLIYLAIRDQSKDRTLSYYIYVCGTLYFASMNTVRQMMSVAMFYFSLKYVESNNWKKYFLCNLIGGLFHQTAFIFLPIYFVLKRYMGWKKYLVVIIIAIALKNPIVNLLNGLILNSKYAMYVTYSNFANTAWGGWKISNFINLILFLAYCLLLKKKDTEDSIYTNIHFVGVLCSILLLGIPGGDRIFLGFRFIELLSVPNLLYKLKLRKISYIILSLVIAVLYLFYFYYTIGVQNGNSVLPYVTTLFSIN
ncbi:hypothetical protein BTI83_05505 [Lactobacillus delbrueckii subsp. bulgaricus]|nr:hypothetical protein [Lactobacillus delbrueckii subsp. bulgaricus]MBT9005896.1 hypothetical protein [Lactobacillus delbrueckii subsp. bulgaricus]MBT9007660.1 hypothetical protein [Lactobacillus delbrueckii subsp. bulgaricus]MBT9014074.1 hypothetical protein [Lactobacillus delbrueckii subsp. bulgaricus]